MKPLYALPLILLAGCAGMAAQQRQEALQAQVNAFVGQHIDEVVKQHGPPQSTFPLANGGMVMEYSQMRQVTRGGGSIPVTRPMMIGGTLVNVPSQQFIPTRSDTVTCRILVTVSPAKLVEGGKVDGAGC